MPEAIFEKNFAFRLCLGQIFEKNLPSGYASGYASGNIFVKSKNFRNFQKDSRRLRPRLRFRQFLKNIYPQAMPRAIFEKNFAFRLCLGQIFKKYLPSGYASGYASGNFFKIFKKIAQGNALSYPSGYALGHPRGCLSLNN
ncbi:hypothetical protein T05_5146 [Trichinella murrelli]|uniref:Uncharacterized protein n=1 Tax=Trichinella murrelli TaxID=144512 RepID=A0A0V0TN75_9BILA|nr:hypothetical protein T05_5146 [Trichinella murrelli]